MPGELENLLSQSMTPCPHCGTPNGADSETCLCCGGRMQEGPDGSETPAQDAGMPDVSGGRGTPGENPAEPGDAPDADEPTPLTQKQKRTRGMLIALAVVCNALLLAVVLIHALYINSPGYRAAELFRVNRSGAAQHLYLQKVGRDDLQRKIMRREMKKYFDELDAQYREGELEFFEYTEKCADILLQYLDEEINRDVRERFHAELEDVYDSYLRTVMGERGAAYEDALFAFSHVINNGLTMGDPTDELFARLKALNQDDRYLHLAQISEQGKNYPDAILNYQKIRHDGPHAEAAAAGRYRCVTAYCTDLRERVHASEQSAGKLHSFRAEANRVLEMYPENGDLQELRDWVQQLYGNAEKQAALAYAADLQTDHLNAIVSLRYALKELPGDAELQAAIDLRAARLKAALPGQLEEIIHVPDLGWYGAMDYVTRVMEVLPEDAEIAALHARMEQFTNHRLCLDDMSVGVEDLFQWYEESPSSGGYYTYSTTPVADAFGVLHAPYALYRFTAAASQTAVWRHRYVDARTSLRFKVSADRNCTGSGVLEVWMIRSAGDDSRWEKYWTSPVLNRTTNGYEVNISLPEAGCQQLELRLVSHTGTVVMLLDDAYLE